MVKLVGGRYRVTRPRMVLTYDSAVDAQRAERRIHSAFAALREELLRPAEACTIEARMEEFLEELRLGVNRRVTCGETTVARHRARLRAFADAWQHRALDLVTQRDLTAWIGKRLRGPRKVDRHTVNLDLGSLRLFAQWAVASGHAPADTYCARLKSLPVSGRVAGNNNPPRFIGREALVYFIRAIAKVRPDIGLFLEGMMYFGLRPAAVAGAAYRNINKPTRSGDGYFRPPVLKRGRSVDIPVGYDSPAADWLRRCAELRRRYTGVLRIAPTTPIVPCRPSGWDQEPGDDEAKRARAGRRPRPRAKLNPGGWTSVRFCQHFKRTIMGLRFSRGGVERFTPYVVRHAMMIWLKTLPDVSADERQLYAGHLRATTQEYYTRAVASRDGSVYAAAQSVMALKAGRPPKRPKNAATANDPFSKKDDDGQ